MLITADYLMTYELLFAATELYLEIAKKPHIYMDDCSWLKFNLTLETNGNAYITLNLMWLKKRNYQ